MYTIQGLLTGLVFTNRRGMESSLATSQRILFMSKVSLHFGRRLPGNCMSPGLNWTEHCGCWVHADVLGGDVNYALSGSGVKKEQGF